MCQPTTCKVCGNTTWAGCGQHIAQVKAGVPAGRWCNGRHTDAEKQQAAARRGGLLSRLLPR